MKDEFLKHHKAWMKDPQYRQEFEALEPEIALVRSLIDARTRLGLTQGDVAERAGLKQEAVARVESGTGNPTFRTLKKIAEALDSNLVLEAKQH